MRRLFTIAVRNVLRNKRRSAISALAIIIGVAASVFLQGMVNGFTRNVLDDTVRGKVGAIRIHRAGYRQADHDMLAYEFAQDPAFEARLRQVPGVTGITPRITFEGMLSNGTVSTMFLAAAVDPKTEYLVCPKRRESVQAGGEPLDEKSVDGTILGHTLGTFLEAKPGSTLTMMSATRQGASNALDVNVRGFLPSRFLFESKRLATVTLGFAQDLLKMQGRVTEYALSVDDPERVDEVVARIQAAIGDGYDVEPWHIVAPMQRDMRNRIRYVMNIVVGVLVLLVATGIINTMLMSVYERVREIGTMMAVGMRRVQVVALFLLEAGTLGLGGSALGAAIGAAVVRRLGAEGVMFRPPGGDPTLVVPYIPLSFVLFAVAFALVGAVLAALYPAWKASRLRPVDALRAN